VASNAVADDPEVVGRLADTDDALAGLERDIDAAAGDQLPELGSEIAEDRVGGELAGEADDEPGVFG
jgi:hypothetical protein